MSACAALCRRDRRTTSAVRRHGYHPLRVKQGRARDRRMPARSCSTCLPNFGTRIAYGPGSSARSGCTSAGDEHPAATPCRARPRSTMTSPSRSSGFPAATCPIGSSTTSPRATWWKSPARRALLRAGERPSDRRLLRWQRHHAGDRRSPRACWRSTERPVRLLYANRDADSVIFDRVARRASSGRIRNGSRFSHHLDTEQRVPRRERRHSPSSGRVSMPTSTSAAPDRSWTWSRGTLLGLGVTPRTSSSSDSRPRSTRRSTTRRRTDGTDAPGGDRRASSGARGTRFAYHAGDTVLETARRADAGRALLVRGRQLRHLHGPRAGRGGHHAGEQCPDPRRGGRKVGS